ncbi:MAG TPA: hypothetical protein VHV81_11165 [Steroidobacteraceae bacterium]|nr:hypothetical protein [Steroidobacteraceae bacterium]
MPTNPERFSRPLRGVLISLVAAGSSAQAADFPGDATSAAPNGGGARAQTFTYGVDAGVGETDNVNLSPTNRVSQTLAIADVDFALREQARLLDVAARGDFSYLDYLQGAYGSQLLGRFDGLGRVALIPDRLTWRVQDDFGQSALDPYTPTTPSNLEDVNFFSTGPDLALRLGGTSFVNMSARYARAQYETSPFNSNRLLGNLAWGLQLSAVTSASLNADTERVLFQNTTLNSDFDRTNVFASYQLQGARTTLTADLGASRVSETGTSTTGPFAKLEVARKISSAAKLTVSAGRELTDASTSFSALQGGATGVVGTAPAAQTSQSYTDTFATAGWQYERNRTTVALSGHWEKNVYDLAPALDYTRSGGEFRVERKLTHALTAQVLGRLYKTDYQNASLGTPLPASPGVPSSPGNGVGSGSADFTDGLVAAAIAWRPGRGLEVKLTCEHSSRFAAGFDAGYRENRAYLTVGYRPRPAEPISNEPKDDPGA